MNSIQINVESLKEALEKTLSENDIGLLLLHLKARGAILENGYIDNEKFQATLKELFGEGALIFFELLANSSRRNEAPSKMPKAH